MRWGTASVIAKAGGRSKVRGERAAVEAPGFCKERENFEGSGGKQRGLWGAVGAGWPFRGGKLGCRQGAGVRIMSGGGVQGQTLSSSPLGRP